jgi:hypothetical protein
MVMNVLEEHSLSVFTGSWKKEAVHRNIQPLYSPVGLHSHTTRKAIILNLNIQHFPCIVSLLQNN